MEQLTLQRHRFYGGFFPKISKQDEQAVRSNLKLIFYVEHKDLFASDYEEYVREEEEFVESELERMMIKPKPHHLPNHL